MSLMLNTPSKNLSRDVIEEELQYWDEWLIEKVKQRYVRLHETLENMRRMKQAPKVKALPIKNKLEKRNRARERRALNVAHVEYTVKEELVKRLHDGVFGEIYNLEEEKFTEALDTLEQPIEFVDESDFEEMEEYEEEEPEKELVSSK